LKKKTKVGKAVDKQFALIEKAEKEIGRLQKKCLHPTYTVMLFPVERDFAESFEPYRICDECDAPLEEITNEEIKQCWNEFDKKVGSDDHFH